MNIFGAMYDKTMQWSKHRFAVFWLSFVSFIEAIFFPVPPDVMLIPMSMSKPKSAFRFALYTTIASVVGGMVMLSAIMPLIGFKVIFSNGVTKPLGNKLWRGLKNGAF